MSVSTYSYTPSSVLADPNNCVVSAPGGPAVRTFTAVAGKSHVINAVHFGYDGAPQAGATIQVEDGAGNVVYRMPVTAAGPGPLLFAPALRGSPSAPMIVTLSAGGGSVLAYLSVPGHWNDF